MQDKTGAHRVALLQAVPLFARLSEKDLVTIANDFRPREYKKDDVIFRQGDESREIYLVRKGKVRIYKISPSGNETSIDIFSTNDLFGEFAALTNEPRNATAQAVGPVSLLVMSQDRFLHHVQTLPGMGLPSGRFWVTPRS